MKRSASAEFSVKKLERHLEKKTERKLDPSLKTISETAFKTLSSNNWLDDIVMDFYLKKKYNEYLKKTNSVDIGLGTATFSNSVLTGDFDKANRMLRNDKISNYKQFIFPICVNHNHWVLGIIEPKRRIIIYDSLAIISQEPFKMINNYLNYLGLKGQYDWMRYNQPEQHDGSSCGVFVLEYAKCILNNSQPNFSQNNIQEKRKAIADEIAPYVKNTKYINVSSDDDDVVILN